MKIAFAASGDTLEAPMSRRFGRAASFLLYDAEIECCRTISNEQNLNAAQGAGIQSAQTVVDSGADAIILTHCGPKAFRVLSAAGLKIYTTTAATVQEALELFHAGALPEATTANVDGHWA